MANYIVMATPVLSKMAELRERLDTGEIAPMRPFGPALDYSLQNARQMADGRAVWEEEDYCRPPLAMERAAVLNDYFTELTVKKVAAGEGWQEIQALPSLWAG